MNGYIISQWFKNKDYLKVYYQDNYNYILEHYRGKTVKDISQELLENLLKLVVNKDKGHIKLSYIDKTWSYSDGGCLYDVAYLLHDSEGFPWMLKLYYGTFDLMTDIRAKTKDEWICILMHLSLHMAQGLKRLDNGTDNTLTILNHSSELYSIKCLIDFRSLDKHTYIHPEILAPLVLHLSEREWQPLLAMLTKEQNDQIVRLLAEFRSSMDKIYDEFCNASENEGSNVHDLLEYEIRPLEEDTTNRIFEIISKCNLKGYMAICEVKSDSGSLGRYWGGNIHDKMRNKFELIAQDDMAFVGVHHILVIGESFEQLFINIEQSYKKLAL